MSTSKTDLWALLREARNSVALEVAAVAAFRVSDADRRVLDLLKRIDAAFARGVAAMREAVKNVMETHDPDQWAFSLEVIPDPEDR